MKPRHYNNGEAEFILEPLSPSLVKVTHRGQVGWFGINLDWDVDFPYGYVTYESFIQEDGISGRGLASSTPDGALQSLCRLMLGHQRREDSQRVNPEERREAARRVLREFLEELPD
jgi:hypothetical protein